MRKYIYIGLGGAAGAILRYLLTEIQLENVYGSIPLSTLFINSTGCFLLAFIVTIALELLNFSPNIRVGIATGFLGAFTTFSALCKQTVDLLAKGYYFSAFTYCTVSVILGFVVTYFGFVSANLFLAHKRKIRRNLYQKTLLKEKEGK